MSTKEQVLELLAKLTFPETSHSLVDLKLVDAVDINDGRLEIRLKLPDPNSPVKDRIQNEVAARVSELPEVDSVAVSFARMAGEEQTAFRQKVLTQAKEQQARKLNIKNVVAVCSGKGGVGKSTITANLSVALSRLGFKVGLLDADVYGFSIPRMMGVNNQQPQAEGDLLIPIESDGVKIISMGFFVPDSEAIIWRGPLLHKAITQFVEDVKWGDLDFLMIDLPPGTGDVTISIAQKLPHLRYPPTMWQPALELWPTKQASRCWGLSRTCHTS